MFGIRLNTLAANLLFGIQCKELKNWSIEGDNILKEKIYFIQEKIIGLPDFHTKAIWLEDFILSQLNHHSDFGMAIKISSLLDDLSTKKSSGEIIRIEDFSGYSRMHTLRIFQKWFGIAPTEALAFKRFERSLKQIHDKKDSLTQIGLDCGFYDQAHFIRVFRKFAEMTPKQYESQKSEVVGQFSF